MDKGNVIPMRGKEKEVSPETREDARRRVYAAFRALEVLAPDADVEKRKRLATEILLLCAGKEHRRKLTRMTPELLGELISVHSQCVHDQERRCALAVFTRPLAWEINRAMGCPDETDRAFRRDDPMCAAKPLSAERFDREDE